jgi:hypothetical protein
VTSRNCFTLSNPDAALTGPVPPPASAEDPRNRRQTAGQQVRVVDLPSDTGVYGLFDTLHGFENGTVFADYLIVTNVTGIPAAVRTPSITPWKMQCGNLSV